MTKRIVALLASSLLGVNASSGSEFIMFTEHNSRTVASVEADGETDIVLENAPPLDPILGGLFESFVSASAVTPNQSAYANATQVSGAEGDDQSDSARLFARGSVFTAGWEGSAYAQSHFRVSFDLSSPAFFDVKATFFTHGDAPPTLAHIALPGGGLFEFIPNGEGLFDVSDVGELAPGPHEFRIVLDTAENIGAFATHREFEVELSLTMIPEPATGGLILIGSLMMFRSRRHQRS